MAQGFVWEEVFCLFVGREGGIKRLRTLGKQALRNAKVTMTKKSIKVNPRDCEVYREVDYK